MISKATSSLSASEGIKLYLRRDPADLSADGIHNVCRLPNLQVCFPGTLSLLSTSGCVLWHFLGTSCSLCDKLLVLEMAKSDERGKPVHGKMLRAPPSFPIQRTCWTIRTHVRLRKGKPLGRCETRC